MPTALITGATAGIGAEFARQLADRGYDLVLVARDEARLQAYAEELHTESATDVEILPADLADREQTLLVAARLEDQSRPVHLLVNNAGFGLRSTMLDPDTTLEERALDVMCRAVMILGNAAARSMKDRGRGIIINTSSVAGLMAMGNYSAIKAWVTAYSESLATQLRKSGVTVTALLPGWVHTEFHDRANINAKSIPDWAWIDKTVVVRDALADAEKGKVLSVPTLGWRLAAAGAGVLPRGVIRWISSLVTSKRH
ncbi:MAG: SDR family NAD(P)-dependent oxidoreductase [Propionibacteriaceae bacterium]|nr:SDR family NAD(P)-dependent oxidoreductase [Propionibacteriaceae bacterium]